MTPTLAPAEAGLLRAIVEDPADDVARLVYAGWLEEHGQTERAEFIRVQCELAEFTNPEPALPSNRDRLAYLRQRERELWREHGCSFLVGLPGADEKPALHPDCIARTGLGPRIFEYTFRRGFVAEVHCRLEDWYGEACSFDNRGCRNPVQVSELYGLPVTHACGKCRVGAHGPAIVAASPIEVVRLTDRKPQETYSFLHGTDRTVWYWNETEESSLIGRAHFLPPSLFSLLSAGRETQESYGMRGRAYDSPDAALDDFSRALITWTRKIAGLPV